MTELVARHTEVARVTMRGMFESATWPLRKLAWMIEEKVLWRVADALRRRPAYSPSDSDSAYIPAQTDLTYSPAAVRRSRNRRRARRRRAERTFRAPPPPRLRDLSIALATVAVAIGAGIGVATMLGKDGGTQRLPPGLGRRPPPSRSLAAAVQRATPGPRPCRESLPTSRPPRSRGVTQPPPRPPTRRLRRCRAPTAKPSSIPPGVASNIAAMNSARDFAGAFVLYEVGESNAKVRKTFARTATPALAKALQDRPPRLPDSVQVPTAKVQNVVLGTPTAAKRTQLDASVVAAAPRRPERASPHPQPSQRRLARQRGARLNRLLIARDHRPAWPRR